MHTNYSIQKMNKKPRYDFEESEERITKHKKKSSKRQPRPDWNEQTL